MKRVEKNLTKRQIASAFQGGNRLARELSREELGATKRGGKKWWDVSDEPGQRQRAKSNDKYFLVSYFSPMRGKRVEFMRPIKARSIADAKQHGRALVTNEQSPKHFAARQVEHNPKGGSRESGVGGQVKKTKNSKLKTQNSAKRGAKKVTCSKCGGAHDAAYCNQKQNGSRKSGVGSPAKTQNSKLKTQNLFGLGGKKKKSPRSKRKSAKRAYKADRLEARARYLRSLNPAERKAFKAAIEKNPHETLSAIATGLGAAIHGLELHKHLTRKPKPRRPSATAAGKRLAQRKHGHVSGKTKTIHRKVKNGSQESGVGSRKATAQNSKLKTQNSAKRNAGEIYEDFTGTPSSQITTGYVAANAPKNVDQLTHDVVQLALETPNGKPIRIGSERDGTARTIRGEIIRFKPEAVKLCAVEQNGKRRFVTTVRAIDREKWLQRNPGLVGNYKRGVVAEVVYRARKPHLYGHNRMLNFYHIVGEEGGRRPTAYLRNGCPSLQYGAWEIKAEGIKN